MSLAAGTRLGPYEVLGLIGAGGMGEVYRARDGKLQRDVAIKILPAAFASDPDRLARFEREAQVLASLNHPNIAAIYGFEEGPAQAGLHVRALVLELVEGPTLADRIAKGPIPFDEALPIARQIVEALEAAHEAGVVHRDLKPANIKLRPDGTVKVLDFGLAKAVEPGGASVALSLSPTITSPALMTGAGAILGTAAYMSPEQARGKPVDKRTDIWAFGCVLYEMLTGERAFGGDDVTDTIAAVVRAEPAFGRLPVAIPPHIRSLVRRCLQKEPRVRLRDIGDARTELSAALTDAIADGGDRLVGQKGRRVLLLAAASLMLGALISAVAMRGGRLQNIAETPDASWQGTLLAGPAIAWVPRISPDGKTLAFITFVDGLTQVAVMDPDSGNWRVLTTDRTRGYVSQLAWARDGSRIYYNRFTDVPEGIYSVPALGGEEKLVLENANGGESLPDGSLLAVQVNATRQMQLVRFWPTDGRVAPLPVILPNVEIVPLRASRDGARVVFWGRSIDQPPSEPDSYLHVLDIASGKVSRLIGRGLSATDAPEYYAIALTSDDRAVVIAVPNGDQVNLAAVDLHSPSRMTPLFNLLQPSLIDIGPDGSIYAHDTDRDVEIWRFTNSGDRPEKLASAPGIRSPNYAMGAPSVHHPDGTTWLLSVSGGRRRLLVIPPGKAAIPFLDTAEETGGPMALVGADRIAFVIGSGEARRIAIASVRDGRILQRLDSVPAGAMTAIATSHDLATLYVVESGHIWTLPVAGGERRKIHSGDGVAVTADGTGLLIQIVDSQRVRWVRTRLDGTMEQPIRVQGDWRFTRSPIGPGAVGPSGRLVVPITVKDSWFWTTAIFDPQTGEVRRVPPPVQGDVPSPAWADDGRIIATTYSVRSTLWRFRPATRATTP